MLRMHRLLVYGINVQLISLWSLEAMSHTQLDWKLPCLGNQFGRHQHAVHAQDTGPKLPPPWFPGFHSICMLPEILCAVPRGKVLSLDASEWCAVRLRRCVFLVPPLDTNRAHVSQKIDCRRLNGVCLVMVHRGGYVLLTSSVYERDGAGKSRSSILDRTWTIHELVQYACWVGNI